MRTRYDDEVRYDDDFGPVERGGRHGFTRWPGERRRGGGGRRLLSNLLILALALAAVPVGIALYASSQIDRIPVENLASGGGTPMHVLVVGSDSREGMTRQEQRELTTGAVAGERTDTIFLMTIGGGKTALLAFPRDLFVTRCDGSQGRINAAMSIGGPGCLVETVTNLSGIPINHYMEVNFLGFRDIVNAVGGVEICLDEPIRDANAGIDLPEGCQVLDGAQALGYARVRGIDNDLERIKRQQRFMKSLAGEIASPATLVNPVRLVQTAGEAGAALTADEGLGVFDLARIAWGLRGLAASGPAAFTVPTTSASIGGASVLQPVDSEAQPLFDRFRSGAILDEIGAPEALRPEDVQLQVLNGAGVEGLATRAAELLRERGFDVVGVGNAPPRDTTVVRYAPDALAEAQVLERESPTPVTLEEDPAASPVTLILGSDAADL